MNERELFLSALEIEDPAARQAHLQTACAGDADLLARVESLLASHDSDRQFVNSPAVGQTGDDSPSGTEATILLGSGSTQDEESDAETSDSNGPEPASENGNGLADEILLTYLQPSSRLGSLGRLAHYDILEVIGTGAFATVLKAFDEKLQRVVAIKVLSPEMAATSPARKRFLREARASAAVRHENVVSIYAVEDDPIPYLVMEYIPGQTLQQRLDEHGPLDLPDVLRLGKQIADGLAAAHAEGLIHRDIKPGNILLETSLDDHVKITDFGLALAADDASMTQSGMIVGTPMYAAPEQVLGQKLDQRADLFSFGSVLYQMLSGRPPFRAPTTVAVLQRVAEDRPRPIREIVPEVPCWMCQFIGHLHAKNPDHRYGTAQQVSDLLAQCLADVQAGRKPRIPAPSWPPEVPACKPSKEVRLRGLRRIFRRPLAAAAAVALLLMVGLGISEATGITQLITSNGRTEVPMSLETAPPIAGSAQTKPRGGAWHQWPADAPSPAIAPFDAEQAREYQEQWAAYLKIPVEYTNSIGMKFILVPPGEFLMGSTPEEIEAALAAAGNSDYWKAYIRSEGPQHKVVLTHPIYLGIHEVTQAQYQQVMGTNPSHFAATGAGKDAVANLDTRNHPVEMVSWNDAAEFCAKLSEEEGLKPFYSRGGETVFILEGTGYRLPTEAEWEFACRGGTTTRFWCGDRDEDLVQAGWFGSKAEGRTHPVGELKANPFGLFDVHCNVWEWVQDGWEPNYGRFAKNPAVDPKGRSSAASPRVIRGGGWDFVASGCRASDRRSAPPRYRNYRVGFRVVMAAP